MKSLILVTAIVLSTLASAAPSNAGFIPQPPKVSLGPGTGKTMKFKKLALNPTHPATGTLGKCKNSGKTCAKRNGKFVTP
jgi:hypothetical protein